MLHRVLDRACTMNGFRVDSDAGSDMAIRVLYFFETGIADEEALLLAALGRAHEIKLVA
jgi:hypothetical protein